MIKIFTQIKIIRLVFSSIPLSLLIVLLVSIFLWPILTPWIGIILLVLSIGMSVIFSVQKHWGAYQQAEYTREKMICNMALDLIGLLLTMGAAMYAGRLAGGYFGLRVGFWVGIIAGFLGGFGAAWVVRSAWGRVTDVLA